MRVLSVATLLCLLLAGCATDEPAPEPEPTTATTTAPAPAPVVPEPVAPSANATQFPLFYTQNNCETVVFIHAVDFAHANSILPIGYVAADLGYLMDLPINLNLAAIGLITYTCQDDDLGVGEHTQAAISVFIETPAINGLQETRDDIFLNVYELHRYFSNDAQAARYAEAGWNLTTGLGGGVVNYIAPQVDNEEHRIPQPAAATSAGTLGGETIWNGGVTGATGFRLQHESIRFWQETPGGVSFVQYTVDKHGRGAASFCEYHPDSLIATLLGRTDCEAGENLGMTVSDFNVVGEIHHLPGVRA